MNQADKQAREDMRMECLQLANGHATAVLHASHGVYTCDPVKLAEEFFTFVTSPSDVAAKAADTTTSVADLNREWKTALDKMNTPCDGATSTATAPKPSAEAINASIVKQFLAESEALMSEHFIVVLYADPSA